MIRCTCCRPLTSPPAVWEVRPIQAAEAEADGVGAVVTGLLSSRRQRRLWAP